MQVRKGFFYRSASGKVFGPMTGEHNRWVKGEGDGGRFPNCWKPDGTHFFHRGAVGDPTLDLIAEVNITLEDVL